MSIVDCKESPCRDITLTFEPLTEQASRTFEPMMEQTSKTFEPMMEQISGTQDKIIVPVNSPVGLEERDDSSYVRKLDAFIEKHRESLGLTQTNNYVVSGMEKIQSGDITEDETIVSEPIEVSLPETTVPSTITGIPVTASPASPPTSPPTSPRRIPKLMSSKNSPSKNSSKNSFRKLGKKLKQIVGRSKSSAAENKTGSKFDRRNTKGKQRDPYAYDTESISSKSQSPPGTPVSPRSEQRRATQINNEERATNEVGVLDGLHIRVSSSDERNSDNYGKGNSRKYYLRDDDASDTYSKLVRKRSLFKSDEDSQYTNRKLEKTSTLDYSENSKFSKTSIDFTELSNAITRATEYTEFTGLTRETNSSTYSDYSSYSDFVRYLQSQEYMSKLGGIAQQDSKCRAEFVESAEIIAGFFVSDLKGCINFLTSDNGIKSKMRKESQRCGQTCNNGFETKGCENACTFISRSEGSPRSKHEAITPRRGTKRTYKSFNH